MNQLETLKNLGVTTLSVTNDLATAVNPYPQYEQFSSIGGHVTSRFENPNWSIAHNRISTLPPLPTSGIPDGTVGIEEVEGIHTCCGYTLYPKLNQADIAETQALLGYKQQEEVKPEGEARYRCIECNWTGTRKETIHTKEFSYEKECCPECGDIMFDNWLSGYSKAKTEFAIKQALSEVITDLGQKDIVLDQDEIVDTVCEVFKDFYSRDTQPEQPEQTPVKFSDLASYVLYDTANDAYIPLDDPDLYFHISGGKVNGVYYRSEEYYEGGGEIHDRETFDEIKSFKIQAKTLSAEQAPEEFKPEWEIEIEFDLMQQIRNRVSNKLVGMNWIDFKKSILFYRFHEEATDNIAEEYANLKVKEALAKPLPFKTEI